MRLACLAIRGVSVRSNLMAALRGPPRFAMYR